MITSNYDNRGQERAKCLGIKHKLEDMQAASPLGVNFGVCTTYMCNLRCPYCRQGHEMHGKPHALFMKEIDNLFQAVDKILQMENERGRFIDAKHKMMLYGGEPLLPTTKRTVHEVVRRGIEEYGFRFYCITNGTFLHEYLDFFEQYQSDWGFFQISIDGPKAIHDKRRSTAGGHGTFERIVHNMQMAMDRGFRVVMRTNVDQDNVHYLQELGRYVKSRDWHDHPNFMWQISLATDDYDGYLTNYMPNYMPEHACTSAPSVMPIFNECAGDFYVFGTEGEIYACPEFVGKKELAVGTFLPNYVLDRYFVSK